ncbi:Conserved hypothetical protein [gamma proteobacterium HdN1]|nr:Conserved hypothetical protein [gamma proteobacterium HdN1]
MSYIIFDLNLMPEEYQKWYSGHARTIVVTARDGRKIQFPVKHLQRFVSHSGVKGTFAIYFDAKQRFKGIKRLV